MEKIQTKGQTSAEQEQKQKPLPNLLGGSKLAPYCFETQRRGECGNFSPLALWSWCFYRGKKRVRNSTADNCRRRRNHNGNNSGGNNKIDLRSLSLSPKWRRNRRGGLLPASLPPKGEEGANMALVERMKAEEEGGIKEKKSEGRERETAEAAQREREREKKGSG